MDTYLTFQSGHEKLLSSERWEYWAGNMVWEETETNFSLLTFTYTC